MIEQLVLIIIIFFVIIVFSQIIVKMMKSGNEKFKTFIIFGRMLLGFLLAMFIYSLYLMLQGEDIIAKLMGS